MKDSELSMLSSLSLTEHSALDTSHHDSITPSHSTTAATAMTSLTTRPSHQSQRVRGSRQDPATPLPHGHSQDWSGRHELHQADKENISPSHLDDRKSLRGSEAPVSSYPQKVGGRGVTTGASGHQSGTGLVLFPEKHVNVSSKSAISSSSSSSSISAPSPHTREMLRQQELQLRLLQEQVCTHVPYVQFRTLHLCAIDQSYHKTL